MKPGRIEIDLNSVATEEELHALLASRLEFPDYYGSNWDAFWDCVCSDDQSQMPETLVLLGWYGFESRLPREARLFKQTIEDMAVHRPECKVEIR
jgi:RNAse (barnase) inhibitor barstar